jgi:hypothetical protein
MMRVRSGGKVGGVKLFLERPRRRKFRCRRGVEDYFFSSKLVRASAIGGFVR